MVAWCRQQHHAAASLEEGEAPLPDVIFVAPLIHVASETVYWSAAVHSPPLAMPLPIEPVPFVGISIVLEERAVALRVTSGQTIIQLFLSSSPTVHVHGP